MCINVLVWPSRDCNIHLPNNLYCGAFVHNNKHAIKNYQTFFCAVRVRWCCLDIIWLLLQWRKRADDNNIQFLLSS